MWKVTTHLPHNIYSMYGVHVLLNTSHLSMVPWSYIEPTDLPTIRTFYVCTLQTVPPLPSSLLITHSSHLRTLAVSLAIGSTCRQVELRSVVRREETALSSRQSKTAFFFLSTPALHPRARAIPGSNREGEGGREGGWVEGISKRGGGECTEEAVQYK